MKNKSKQAVIMQRHLDNISTAKFEKSKDPTMLNYIALLASILDQDQRGATVHSRHLEEPKVAYARMKEIDELRARGEKTIYEKDKKEIEQSCTQWDRRIALQITNLENNEVKVYESIKEACDEIGLTTHNVRYRFKIKESNEIQINNLILEKVDRSVLESQIKGERIYLKEGVLATYHKRGWTEEEKAFIVQSRKEYKTSWKDIAENLRKEPATCSAMFSKIKKQNLIDYYMEYDLTDKIEKAK